MGRDDNRPHGRFAIEGSDSRRLPRAPEPRPASEAEIRSVLLSRHLPQSQAAPPVRAESNDVWEEADVPHTEAAPWPPEPPPIDFQDREFLGDERDQRGRFILDQPEPVQRDIPSSGRPPARRKVQADAGSRSVSAPRTSRDRVKITRPVQNEAHTLTPVVPSQSVAGRALILVVAIMCFLACLSVGALVLVEDAARDWQLDVSREVTIQVKPVDGKPIEPMLQQVMDLARSAPGIANVRLMSERDGEALLEPWLGSGFDYSKLPMPRLILMDLADPATADLKGLASQLKAGVPSAELDDHSIWAKRLRTMAGTMVATSVVVLVLVLAAMVLSVVFATRAAMAGNRDVIQVLHFVGAEDSFVAGEFQHHFLLLGFKGGVGGGVGAMLAFLLASWVTDAQGVVANDQAHALFGSFSVGMNGYIGAALIVLLVAGLTAVTSRLTVRSYLNQLD